MQMFSITASGGTQGIIEFDAGDGPSTDQLILNSETTGTTALNWELEWKFRDPAAWYHFVMVYDTTQATTNDRVKVYINGEQAVDGWDRNTTPAQNQEQAFNSTNAMNIGKPHAAISAYFDGYMAEIHFIDGTALDATSFGETNSDGVWIPKKYSGDTGTNGFYITGETAGDLGEDFSGNSNDFTSSGLATTDQMLDTPTDNFAVLNYIQQNATGLSDGNLQFTTNGSGTHKLMSSTIAVSSGKWYAEAACNATLDSNARIGIIPDDNVNFTGSDAHVGDDANSFAYVDNGQKESNNTQSAYGASYANGDVIGIALNLNDDEITFYKNGVSQGAISITASTEYRFAASQYNSGGMLFNFGQSAFTYTPPTGFNVLSTADLPDPTIADPSAHFQTTVYTGNGSTLEVNQSGNSTFQPDWVWGKRRNAAESHALFDAVRGTTKIIYSNLTNAEITNSGLTAFDADGFTIGSSATLNANTGTYVAWQWKANGSGSSNTDGTVSSTVSANTTAGFSIAKWTHTTASNYTVGHGLGAVPKMILVKTTDQGTNWGVYHSDITVGNRLILNSTSAQTTGYWGANSWTSSTFSIGSARDANGSTAVAYCFAEVDGFSKMGSYTGNGSSDGPFVYTGMTPEFVIIKRTNTTENWIMLDNARSEYNVTDDVQYSNLAQADGTNSATTRVDNVSNGFKVRGTNTNINASGSTYIYMAFASSPFKTATAR